MEIKQISETDWNEIANPFDLATIPLLPSEFSHKFQIQSFEYNEDGLGLCTAFLFEIDGSKYESRSFLNTNGDAKYLNVAVLSTEPDSLKALDKLLDILELTKDHLSWINPNLGVASRILARIDDNGNEIEMFRFQEEFCANWVMKKYEAKGHKQHYFVRKVT